MKNKKSIISNLLLIAGVLVLINIISDSFFFRLDFTEDQRYTLSNATKKILKDLQEPVTITAYFSEDLPAEIAAIRRDFKEMLFEYSTVSKGKIVYNFTNPNKDQESEMKAMQEGVQPVLINVPGKNKFEQMKAFLGAVIKLGDKTESIPVIQPGASMEFALSSAIKKLTIKEKPQIALLQGHGEPKINALQEANTNLSILYEIVPVYLNDSINDLLKYKTTLLIAPTDSFRASHLKHLSDFISNGGNLLIAINRVKGDFNTASGTEINTGLEQWLADKGINVEKSFVIDAKCGTVGVRQQQGMFMFNTQIMFPYLPIISNFTEHPITKGIEGVVLLFASPITYKLNNEISVTKLAMTSEKSGTQPCPTYFDINKQWTTNDFISKNITVAIAVEGKLIGDKPSKLIVIGDGDFAVNGEGENAQRLQPDNVNFLVNAVDWLSDDTGLIELRTKGITMRPIKELEDGTKALIKWLNFLIPIILVIIYGIIRMQIKRNIKVKRMEEGYVQ